MIIVTDSDTVNKMYDFEPKGNIIDNNWFKTIQRNGKADLIAINILADIVYWYRPTIIRDEATGNNISFKKKFAADLLQRSYESYAKQFGLSKRQVTDAITRLDEIGVVKKVFRNIRTKTGMFISNVLYLQLDYNKLQSLSSPTNVFSGDISRKKEIPITQDDDTYTKITTQTTTQTTNIKHRHFPGKNVYTLSSEGKELFDFYCRYYEAYTGEEHKPLSDRTIERINELTETLSIFDEETEDTLDVDEYYLQEMVKKYFSNNYNCDRNINHFLNEKILRNLYYQANTEFEDKVMG